MGIFVSVPAQVDEVDEIGGSCGEEICAHSQVILGLGLGLGLGLTYYIRVKDAGGTVGIGFIMQVKQMTQQSTFK